ncbi:hypothetical protein [Larkinella sp. C7]|uniref:hypothetical protein n=1 Tax=Larkinella sp. C7 TaxID=2576607 RepID=UPI001111576B|nr:hypothetical protein [Larkinella sp. C7]
MKRKDLEKMITLHESYYRRAKAMLDERYFELEERGEEMKWIKEYAKQKTIIAWLREQKADDE